MRFTTFSRQEAMIVHAIDQHCKTFTPIVVMQGGFNDSGGPNDSADRFQKVPLTSDRFGLLFI